MKNKTAVEKEINRVIRKKMARCLGCKAKCFHLDWEWFLQYFSPISLVQEKFYLTQINCLTLNFKNLSNRASYFCGCPSVPLKSREDRCTGMPKKILGMTLTI